MADNDLNVKITADASALNAELDAAAGEVQTFAGSLKDAMAEAEAATKRLADAQKQLGAAAAQGNAAAAEVIAQYQAELDKATATVASLSASESIGSAATRKYAEDMGVATAATYRYSEAMGTARIAAGALTGSVGGIEYGLARAAAGSAVLGPLLEAAFPVAAALGLLDIVSQFVSKLIDLHEQWDEVAQAEKRAATEADGVISAMQSAQEHASVAARDLYENKFGHIAALKYDLGNLRLTVNSDDLTKISEAQTKVDELNRRITAGTTTVASGTVAGPHGEAIVGTKTIVSKDAQAAQAELANATGTLAAARMQLKADTDQLQTSEIQLREAEEDQANKGSDAAEKAAQAHMKALEAQLKAMNAAEAAVKGHGLAPGEVASYWTEHLEEFAQGSTQYITILDSITRATEQNHRQISEARKKQAEEAAKSAEEQVKAEAMLAKGTQAAENMVRDALLSTAQARHDQATESIGMAETKVSSRMTLGVEDPEKGLTELRSLHEQMNAENERFIEQEMELYAKQPVKVRELQKQLDEAHRKGLQQELADTTKILHEQEQTFKRVYASITQDFNSAINKMITTTEGPARAFAQMLNEMLGQLADFVLRYLEQKAEMWLLDKVLTTSGTAAQHATQTAANVLTVTGDAGVAAANTFAYYTAIDPPIAPAMAAAAAAQTMSYVSLAAFEAGGVVQGAHGMPVPVLAHAGERVLSAPQTQKFDQLVNQSGGRSNTVHMHYEPTVQAYDRTGMSAALRSHSEDLRDIMRQFVRSEAFA